MCQVNCTAIVGCSDCGAGYYENSAHVCKVFVPFEKWDADLQKRAKAPLEQNPLYRTMQEATRSVAGWPLWMRQYAHADEFRFSVGRPR